jgi:hypothetical protein
VAVEKHPHKQECSALPGNAASSSSSEPGRQEEAGAAAAKLTACCDQLHVIGTFVSLLNKLAEQQQQ